jgi:hypothetical protein
MNAPALIIAFRKSKPDIQHTFRRIPDFRKWSGRVPQVREEIRVQCFDADGRLMRDTGWTSTTEARITLSKPM